MYKVLQHNSFSFKTERGVVKVVRSGRMVLDDKIDGASKTTTAMMEEYTNNIR